MTAPYRDLARAYFDAGWAPIPLEQPLPMLPAGGFKDDDEVPPGLKHSPVHGWTGKKAASYPSESTVAGWVATHGTHNIALRMPEDVIGIDVDAYNGKLGAIGLAEAERLLGPLPLGPISTARPGSGSGIRYFLTTPAIAAMARSFATHVDIIRPGHRYAMVWPSLHYSGERYRWCDLATGEEMTTPPAIEFLPRLPKSWERLFEIDKGKDYAMYDLETGERIKSQSLPISSDGRKTNCEAYVRATITKAAQRITQAIDGERNQTLNNEVFAAARFVHGCDEVNLEGMAREEFASAGRSIGLTDREIKATLDSAFGAASKEPRLPPNTGSYQFHDGAPRAERPAEPAGERERPMIIVGNRPHGEIAKEMRDALTSYNAADPRLWMRAGCMVHVAFDENEEPAIIHATEKSIRLDVAESACFEKYIKRDGEMVLVPTEPPDKAIATLVTSPGLMMNVPVLRGVVRLPVVRRDGSVFASAGYDRESGMYHHHTGRSYPSLPMAPSPAQVEEAMDLLNMIFADFPFDTSSDRANLFGLLLTGVVRHLINEPVPLALIDAPSPGTGKTLMAEVVAIILTGRVAPLAGLHRNEDELEKRITSQLSSASTLIVWDNVEGTLKSEALTRLITSTTWEGRLLGQSRTLQLDSRRTWIATGNNITVGGDFARRCYRVRLDTHDAAPWERSQFKLDDLRGWVTENRPEVVNALLTLVRSWFSNGTPPPQYVRPMGSFSAWRYMVGGILEHVGVSGFLDNVAELLEDADSDANDWEGFILAIYEEWGLAEFTIQQIIKRAEEHGSIIRDHLPAAIAKDWGTTVFGKRFGDVLRSRADRFHGKSRAVITKREMTRTKIRKWAVSVDLEEARGLPAGNEGNRASGFIDEEF